jgi:hypothetical protein
MSVAGEVTYLRRFAGKFVEIVAAGIGTAVSGYLVAHLAGYFSFSTPAAVEATTPPQAISWSTEPRHTEPFETRVRAALASLDVSRTALPAADATPQPPTLASPISSTAITSTPAPTSTDAVAPPLAATEIKSLPVAAAVDPALPPEQDAMADRPPMNVGSTTMLPPQPPPANGGLFSALKHFHSF